MQYEIEFALSYTLPKRKQIQIGFIGLLSSTTISLIVWAVLVFFSTTGQFEKRWSEKISWLLGPVQIFATPDYFDLPENRIDALSYEEGFQARRFSRISENPNFSWDPDYDNPLPADLYRLYKASQDKSIDEKNRRALIQLKTLLEKKAVVSFCETGIYKAQFLKKDSAIEQYISCIGRDIFFLPQRSWATQWDVESAQAFLCHIKSENSQQQKIFFQLYAAFPWRLFCRNQREPREEQESAVLDTTSGLIQLNSGSTLSVSEFLASYTIEKVSPIALDSTSKVLPLEYIPKLGYPIYLPKQMQQHRGGSIALFSRVSLSESVGDTSSDGAGINTIVMGFFDPGILPIGGKICVTSHTAVTSLNPSLPNSCLDPFSPSSSLIVYPRETNPLDYTKSLSLFYSVQKTLPEEIQKSFRALSYQKYPSTEELFIQLKNEKTIFYVLASVLLVGAVSQIFSTLFILVHTKEKEIAILQALGSSTLSIQLIFIISGLILGAFGAFFGSLLAQITLLIMPELIQIASSLQGHEILQSSIYGIVERMTLDPKILFLCWMTTICTSGFAGWLASLKALKIDISDALRSG